MRTLIDVFLQNRNEYFTTSVVFLIDVGLKSHPIAVDDFDHDHRQSLEIYLTNLRVF